MIKKPRYKVRSVRDDIVFDSIQEACDHYNMTYDQIAYRLDKPKDYTDGLNFQRIFDNTEALESVKAFDSSKFVEKYGEKEVPVPGYEGKYTIDTHGVIKNKKNFDRVLPVKTVVTTKHTVILHSLDNKKTQTHSLPNLMKKAFGDPEA